MTTAVTEFIEPTEVEVFLDDSNNTCVRIAGEGEWEKVTARLAFPYSEPRQYIILYQDEEEIGIIQDLAELEEDSRQVLEGMLRKRYHIPEIHRILAVEDAHNATRWVVVTSHGRRDFLVRDRHNFRRVKGRGLVIVDVDGNRFWISREREYDKISQKFLDMHA